MHYLIGFLLFSLVCAFFKWFFPALFEFLSYISWFFYFITWMMDCGWRLVKWAFAGKKGTKPRFHKLYSPLGLWRPPDPDDPADLDDLDGLYDPAKKKMLQKILIAVLLLGSFVLLAYCLQEGREYRMNKGKGYKLPQAQEKAVQVKNTKETEDLKQLPAVTGTFDRTMEQQFGAVYEYCQLNNYELIHIYVKPTWYNLSEDEQKRIITQAAEIFKEILRNCSIANHNVSIYFVDSTTQKNVGSWGDFSRATVRK